MSLEMYLIVLRQRCHTPIPTLPTLLLIQCRAGSAARLKPDEVSPAPRALGALLVIDVILRHVAPSASCLKCNRRVGIGLGDKGEDTCTNDSTDPENTGSRPGPT